MVSMMMVPLWARVRVDGALKPGGLVDIEY